MEAKDTLFSKKTTINCGGKIIDLSEPKVMGIINITPDSFYDGSRFFSEDEIEKRTLHCLKEGADMLDIGAYSSRPGAEDISEKDEYERLNKAFGIIRNVAPDIIISLDTFRANIAKSMIEKFSIDIINDISGGQLDPEIYDVAAEYKTPYILMHMKGKPRNMQVNPEYDDVFQEILTFFIYKIDELLKKGVHDIIIDPGFGFGKKLEHNYEIMNYLEDFRIIEYPLLVGVSRKSMIYRLFETDPNNALNGTTAMHMAALMKGANILRVHDVKEAKEVVKLYNTMKQNGNNG